MVGVDIVMGVQYVCGRSAHGLGMFVGSTCDLVCLSLSHIGNTTPLCMCVFLLSPLSLSLYMCVMCLSHCAFVSFCPPPFISLSLSVCAQVYIWVLNTYTVLVYSGVRWGSAHTLHIQYQQLNVLHVICWSVLM